MKASDALDEKQLKQENLQINMLIELAALVTDHIGAMTTKDVLKKSKDHTLGPGNATAQFNYLLLVNLLTFQEILLKMFMQRMAEANRLTREVFESGKIKDPKFMEQMRDEFKRLVKRATGEDDKIGVG